MKFDIATLKRNVLALYPYFGSVASSVEYIETNRVKSMSSNAKAIYYNPEYMIELNINERLFMLAHELCHVAFKHAERGKGKDPIVWKKATDAVVNQMLKADGMELPFGSLDHPEAADCDAEEYYEILMEYKLASDLINGNIAAGDADSVRRKDGAEQGSGSTKKSKEDSNSDKSGRKDENANSDETDNSAKAGDSDDGTDNTDDEAKNAAEELFRKLAEEQGLDDIEFADEDEFMDEDPDSDRTGEEQEDGPEEIDLDAEYEIQAVKKSSAGNSVEPGIREVGEIGFAKPLVDWKVLLRDTINYGLDWSYKNATIEGGIVRPMLEEIPMPETEIVLDTSWSVEEELLRNFLRECRNLLPLSKLKVGCFDTTFYGFHEIRTMEDIEEMTFEGGGGTDFNVAVDAFTLRVDNRIIFTDGEAPIPDVPLNVIWMIYGDEKIEPPGGTVIHIKPEWLVNRN